MKQNLPLTITSLLTLILFSFHLTDDTLHAAAGMDAAGTAITLGIMIVLLSGIVIFPRRRLGFVIMLLGGLASLYMPFLHTLGPRATRWGWFFVWTMIAMGATGAFSAILAGMELARSFRKSEALR